VRTGVGCLLRDAVVCSKKQEALHMGICIRRFHSILAILLSSTLLFPQAPPPQNDPQAVALAQQAVAALTNGVAVSDVTLKGNARWIAGSDNETGTATFLAKGTSASRMDLNLSGGNRTEIRNDSTDSPQGETITTDGTTVPWGQHNCWVNASWFFPALSILAATSDPSVIFSFVGTENHGGGSVQHIRVYRYVPSKSGAITTLIHALSSEDIYLDSTSLIPVAFRFNSHPDDDEDTNILVEIAFHNYQQINGVRLPMRVQKLINGGLALDVTVTSIVLNSGLTNAQFALQ